MLRKIEVKACNTRRILSGLWIPIGVKLAELQRSRDWPEHRSQLRIFLWVPHLHHSTFRDQSAYTDVRTCSCGIRRIAKGREYESGACEYIDVCHHIALILRQAEST